VRRMSIRLKLAAALAVPVLGLAAVTLAEVASTSAELDDVREQSELALATTGPTGLLTALQNERAWPAAELVGLKDVLAPPVQSYQETWDATDAAIETFRADLESKPRVIREAFADALAGLDELRQIRADVDANAAPRDLQNLVFSESIFDRYSGVIAPFFEATARIAPEVSDAELREGAALVDTTARQIEVMAQLLNALISDAAYSNGMTEPAEIADVQAMVAQAVVNVDRLRTASDAYQGLLEDHLPAELVDRVSATVDATVGRGVVEDVGPLAEAFATPPGEGYAALREELSAAIRDRADDLTGRAEARQALFVGMAALVLAATTVLVFLVSRSITRPLRSLTEQATAMAQHGLPEGVRSVLSIPAGEDVVMPWTEPVRVTTRDEVADVADALNVVLDTAMQLAAEQAVLRRNIADSFVNLARRNQNLLGRQIDFITQLESLEADADALSNLFRLDHLATRMRRNAESLLVLAGVEPPRQWAAPVPVADVVRAALSEVEDYQRILVGAIEPATVTGSVTTDLAHLLAELMENALVFSPPEQPVEVYGAGRADGSYALVVVDTGAGMPPADIEAANRRVAGDEQFTVAPSRYLGHYVAGRLAARHRIGVRLEPSPTGGITAVVVAPPGLVEPAPTTGPTVPVAHLPEAQQPVGGGHLGVVR
jgi:signal transduction histidine kinase